MTCNLTRAPNESWLDALLRVARVAGMEDEARAAYLRAVTLDVDREAALAALEECELGDLADRIEAEGEDG